MSSLKHLNHPLNKSPTKVVYTFPKAKRFLPKQKQVNDLMYDTFLTPNKRSALFDKAKKEDRNSKFLSTTPSPNKYNVDSEFSKTKGYTFNKSPKDPLAKSINIRTQFQNKFSNMLNKISRIRTKQDQTPGPGAYKFEIDKQNDGLFITSKSRNITNVKFTRQKKQSYSPRKNFNPGPGSYNFISQFGDQI